MKILIDTNVVLDTLLKRPFFYQDSFAIFQLIDRERITGYITASAITDIFYIAKKEFGNAETVYIGIDKLIDIFSVATVTESTITTALALRWKDFEDAVHYATAKENNIDYIITRNSTDFKNASIPCMSPTDFITFLKEKESTE